MKSYHKKDSDIKMSKVKKANSPLVIFGRFIIVISVIACFVSIILNQASLVEKQKEFQELEQRSKEVKAENEELQRLIEGNDINSYKEKKAFEDMNYAYPNEIRFYDTSRN